MRSRTFSRTFRRPFHLPFGQTLRGIAFENSQRIFLSCVERDGYAPCHRPSLPSDGDFAKPLFQKERIKFFIFLRNFPFRLLTIRTENSTIL